VLQDQFQRDFSAIPAHSSAIPELYAPPFKAPSKAAAVKATTVTDDPATATAGVRLTALRNQIE